VGFRSRNQAAIAVLMRDTMPFPTFNRLRDFLDTLPGRQTGAYDRLHFGTGSGATQANPACLRPFRSGPDPTADHRPLELSECAGNLEELRHAGVVVLTSALRLCKSLRRRGSFLGADMNVTAPSAPMSGKRLDCPCAPIR
jgi:hypothetical protein